MHSSAQVHSNLALLMLYACYHLVNPCLQHFSLIFFSWGSIPWNVMKWTLKSQLEIGIHKERERSSTHIFYSLCLGLPSEIFMHMFLIHVHFYLDSEVSKWKEKETGSFLFNDSEWIICLKNRRTLIRNPEGRYWNMSSQTIGLLPFLDILGYLKIVPTYKNVPCK